VFTLLFLGEKLGIFLVFFGCGEWWGRLDFSIPRFMWFRISKLVRFGAEWVDGAEFVGENGANRGE